MKKTLTIVIVAVLALVSVAQAQTVRVAVDSFDPFVRNDNGTFTGFDIELWSAIAEDNGWETEYFYTNTVKDILTAVHSDKADVGISGITINSKRVQDVQFSQPYFDSNLQLLLNKKGASAGFTEKAGKIAPILKPTLLLLFAILTVFAHAIWFIERYNEDDTNFHRAYFPGIFDAYWWSIVTATTVGYGDLTPKRQVGRIVAALVMIVGIMWFGYFTGSCASIISILEQDGATVTLSDMNGKTIGTKTDSTAHELLKTYDGITIAEYDDVKSACKDASIGKIDGVFFDSPALIRFAKSNNAVVLAGKVRPEKYGIVTPNNSSYLNDINISLLKMQEDGRYDKIYNKWFGEQ